MKRITLLMALALLARTGLSQTNPSDSQTQRQILEELRAIHRDMRANSTLQLLLAELQLSQTSLDRAAQRSDSLKTEVAQLKSDEKSAQAEVSRYQDGMAKVINPEQQFVDRLEDLKNGLRKVTEQEQAKSEQLETAEMRLRSAQADVDNIQGQLGDLVKKLGSAN